MLLRQVPRKFAKWIHPSIRRMVTEKRKRFHVHRTVSQKISKRTLMYCPLSRVFPWYCEVCTLSSRFLHIIRRHDCTFRNESKHIVDFDNEVRIAQLGYNSKAKDSWAVMERLEQPQYIDLSMSVHDHRDQPTRQAGRKVPLLSELCIASVAVPRDDCTIPTKEEYIQIDDQKPCSSLPSSSSSSLSSSTASPAPSSSSSSAPVGYYCSICSVAFPAYLEYDLHIAMTDCSSKRLPEPIPIQMSCEPLVAEYAIGRRKHRPLPIDRIRVCSACLRDDFHSDGSFHQHIFECARHMHDLEHKALA